MITVLPCALIVGKEHITKFYHTATALYKSSAARNVANRRITSQSAALILMLTRQVRLLGFSIPRVTEAIDNSSAALLAAVRIGT